MLKSRVSAPRCHCTVLKAISHASWQTIRALPTVRTRSIDEAGHSVRLSHAEIRARIGAPSLECLGAALSARASGCKAVVVKLLIGAPAVLAQLPKRTGRIWE